MGASDEGAARLWQPRTGRVRVLLRILNQRLRRLALLFSVVFAAVSVAEYLVEHAAKDAKILTLGDSVWCTVVTMATVGYGDVYPVTSAGRVIMGGFILFMLVTIGFLLTAFSEAVLEVKRMEELGIIGTDMRGHIVMCGYGPVARTALEELFVQRRQVALLCHTAEEVGKARQLAGKELLYATFGEPTHTVLRERLNIAAATTVVIAYADDTQTLIAALNARHECPSVRVVVALQRDELRQTMIASGVTYVASPHELSGRLVASAAWEPEVALLIDDVSSGLNGTHNLEQFAAGKLAGLTIDEVRRRLEDVDGPLLVGLVQRTADGRQLVPHPRRDVKLTAEDQIIVLTAEEEAARMCESFDIPHHGRVRRSKHRVVPSPA
jgi:voltage-gated potassium channel